MITLDPAMVPAEPTGSIWRSRAAITVTAVALLGVFLAAYDGAEAASTDRRRVFFCDAVRQWQHQYAVNDLRVIVTDVTFRASSARFVDGEGAVIAPVAIELPSVQEVLDVRADPAPLRILHVEGNTAIAWGYAGRLHRDLTYEGLALVRLGHSRQRVTVSESPSFSTLPDPWRIDARQTAEELDGEEHGLDQCKDFAPRVKSLAGPPPYTDQLLRIAQGLQTSLGSSRRYGRDEDLCASLRSGSLSLHEIQVLATMGIRELGAPALAFTTADPQRLYLVATYVDGLGWITVDVHAPTTYEAGAAPAVTMAPLTAPFDGAQHGFWYASGAAYARAFGRTVSLSATRWAVDSRGDDDVTVSRSMRLDEACR